MASIKSITIEAFCWPTEDINKVIYALSTIIPARFKMSRVRGQFGEKIIILRKKTSDQNEIKQIIKNIKPLITDIKKSKTIMIDKQKLLDGIVSHGKGVKVQVRY